MIFRLVTCNAVAVCFVRSWLKCVQMLKLFCLQDEQRKDTLKKNLLLLVLHYLNEEG